MSIIEDPKKIKLALAASGPLPLRLAFESDDTVKQLIEHKDAAGEVILNRLGAYKNQNYKDITLACYGYILEKVGYQKAISVLGGILDDLLKKREIVFSPHFFTHTIKVFTQQPELDTVNFSYSNTDIKMTIERLKSR
ncbi:unnamed protein product, partial [marine sediment metagenome]